MNDLLELQVMATKLVRWPSGPTYTCDHHAEALQMIGSAMGIHIAVEEYTGNNRKCIDCFNENSIARGDADKAVNDNISDFGEYGSMSDLAIFGNFEDRQQ